MILLIVVDTAPENYLQLVVDRAVELLQEVENPPPRDLYLMVALMSLEAETVFDLMLVDDKQVLLVEILV